MNNRLKLSLLLVYTVSAFVMPDQLRMAPVQQHLLQEPEEMHEPLVSKQKLAATGTMPCVFENNNAYYDFTPLRLATSAYSPNGYM